MKVGLFFGSFNPVHVGHMIIADFMYSFTDLDEVWFVVSPHNPFKQKSTLANDYDRLHLVNLAIGDHTHLRASNIEFSLPQPSYTIDTLTYLKEKHPDKDFALIMGSDNLVTFHKWKNYEAILKYYSIYVYQRPDFPIGDYGDVDNVRVLEAPLLNISASFVRQCIRDKKAFRYLLPKEVYEYIAGSNLYANKNGKQ